MRVFTSVHLLLLAYIIVALVFWEISLQKQSGRIYEQQLITLHTSIDSTTYPDAYNAELKTIRHNLDMRTKQYLGEGATFMFVILIGAFIVYRAFKRRIWLSRQQNNFMLSVTHELKSPIAAIKLNLQTLEKHKLDEEKRKQLSERCIREVDRLNDLCNNMLLASQIEGKQYKPAKERFDLSELIHNTVKDYATRYPGRFEENIIKGITTTGDSVMLTMALSNLFENAVKYSPNDKPVAVKLFSRQDKTIVQVIDQGEGIPEHEKKNIFNKFYRIGNENNRKTKGTGIGLYLTNKIVLQHKGTISVKENVPNGSIFEIVLP